MSECTKAHLQQYKISFFSGRGPQGPFPERGKGKGRGYRGKEKGKGQGREGFEEVDAPPNKIYHYTTGANIASRDKNASG